MSGNACGCAGYASVLLRNHLNDKFHAAGVGISTQGVERGGVVFFAQARLDACNHWLCNAHARGHFGLRQASSCTRLEQRGQSGEFVFQCIVGDREFGIGFTPFGGLAFGVKGLGTESFCLSDV